jgi:hypothetical protein
MGTKEKDKNVGRTPSRNVKAMTKTNPRGAFDVRDPSRPAKKKTKK